MLPTQILSWRNTMELLKNIYTVTLYENGKFCWVVEKRKKSSEDYESDIKWMLGIVIVTLAVICLVT